MRERSRSCASAPHGVATDGHLGLALLVSCAGQGMDVLQGGRAQGRSGHVGLALSLRALTAVIALLATCPGCAAGTASSKAPSGIAKPRARSAERVAPSNGSALNQGNGPVLVAHLSPSAAQVPELAESFAVGRAISVARDGVELDALAQLHDDPKADAVCSAQRPGISISGGRDRLELVERLADWEHGGEAPNPPPLTAIRIATFQGLAPAQLAAMVELAVSTLLIEERRTSELPSSALRLKMALERASSVAEDARGQPGCRAPCQAWPWQTVWSVLTTSARAKWRQGARLRDPALLEQSVALARRALSAVPETHVLTAAVSQRLLGAVLHELGSMNGDDAVVGQSLAASERALTAFAADQHRYDWALTQNNVQATLGIRITRSASRAAVDDALVVSERILSVLDQRTPNLRAQALLERARLLHARWARSGDQHDLSEAVRVMQEAARVSGVTGETLVIAIALARCDLESEVAIRLGDVQGLKQVVTECERLSELRSLPESFSAEAHRSYGVALGRLAVVVGDAAMESRAVEQLEQAIEAADRVEGKHAGVKALADYAWGLLQLGRWSTSMETGRKAASVSAEALALTSKQAAPLLWGQIKQLQGTTLVELGWKLRAAMQLEDAASFYRQGRAAFVDALSSFSKDDNPKRWAELQRRMGQAFAREGELAGPQRSSLFGQAIACYERALRVNDRKQDPEGFAEAQFGLGGVYLIWADQEGLRLAHDTAKRSVAAFRTALDVFQELGRIKSIADTKAHLADALGILELSNSASACDAALLRLEAVRADPLARGLWRPAQMGLADYARSQRDWTRCPQLPPHFWEYPPKPTKTP